MENIRNEYQSYQNMISTITTALSDMERLCGQLKLEENRQEVERIQKKLSSHTFSVGIMGEFKRGKSTVINSLLEKEIMPADILPCSATMNRVTYDLHPHVQLYMQDGSVKDIPVEDLATYVTKTTAENESRAAEVNEAVVYYPCRFCQNGVDIVDTPGLNDDERMNKISEEVIPKLDAVIMVMTPDNPFSMSEAEFVRSKLMASDLGRMIFLVNKIDTIRRAADRQRVVDGIREKIQTTVVEKMANLYGDGSPEYEEAVKKLGQIRVYPLSALDALDGKMTGDQALIDGSGTVEFEAALTRMLTEERGLLELSSAVNVIAKTAVAITNTVALRKDALELTAQEFAESQERALEEIKRLRDDKKQERKRLQENARTAKLELEKQIEAFYPTLTDTLKSALDSAVAEVDVKKLERKDGVEATAKELSDVISAACQREMSLFSEKLMNELDKRIGKDLRQTEKFFANINAALDGLNTDLFRKKGGLSAVDFLAGGFEAFTLLSGVGGLGLGGVIAGFRSGGLLGALAGGGIGAAVTSLAVLGIYGALGYMTIPLVVISSLAGTLSSKFAVDAMFKGSRAKKELEKLKTGLYESIEKLVTEMQSHRELESWCGNAVDQRYNALIAGMEEETERLLKATETSIDQIKHDITENDMQRKQISEQLDQVLDSVGKIMTDKVSPISTRIQNTLKTS